METNENTNTTANTEVTANVVTPTVTESKSIQKRKAVQNPKSEKRTVGELMNVSVKSMSDAEKAILIETLRNDNRMLIGKLDAMTNNAKSAYEQSRNIETNFMMYKQQVRKFVEFTMNTLHFGNVQISLAAKELEEQL